MHHPSIATPILLAGFLAPMLVLTACSGAASAPSVPAVPAADSAPAQPKVNRVVLGVDPPPDEGNELPALSTTGIWQLRPMYEYLIALDPKNGKFVPQLATEWKLRPDGISFEFKLRQGVKFHGDNGDFTSADIKPSWQANILPDFQNSPAIFLRGAIGDIEPQGDYGAIVQLKRPDGNFLNSISEQRGILNIISSKQAAKTGRPTMQTGPVGGTAPYQFSERTVGQYLRYQRTPYKHWRTTPDFPEVEFRWIKEASTRMAALLAGEVQIANLPQDQLAQAEKQGYKVVKGNVAGLRTYMSMHCCYMNDINDPAKGFMYPNSPLADVRVRKALSKAINRDELNKAFFGGKGETMAVQAFHPTRPGWNPDWEKRYPAEYGYDVAAARDLLAQAGYGPAKPLSTSLFLVPAAGYSGAQDMGEAIGAFWRAAGVNVSLLNLDRAAISAGANALKWDNHIIIDATASDQATGTQNYGNSQGVRGSGIELPEADAFFKQVSNTLDEAEQDRLWRKMGDIRYEQHHEIPLFWLPVEVAVDGKIVGGWTFPGSITGSWTHVENIAAAR